MDIDKSLLSGSLSLVVLKLLQEDEMYGYQIISNLEQRSNNVFSLKAGTLYPILHNLEKQKYITSYKKMSDKNRIRKYYKITEDGKACLVNKKDEWNTFYIAVNKVLSGGLINAEL